MRKMLPLLLPVFVWTTFLGAQAYRQLYVGDQNIDRVYWADESAFDGRIIFCRGYFWSVRQEPEGIGWWTDYPGADHNFLVRLSELTTADVRFRTDDARIPFYVTVALDDPLLMKCPVLFMSDIGTAGFREGEVANLRRYLDKGGFVWVDDFWGTKAWQQYEDQIRRVLPSGTHPMRDLGPDHPVFHQQYRIEGGIWQQPHVNFWYLGCGISGEDANDGGYDYSHCHATSERGSDSKTPSIRGIFGPDGKLVVLSTHNTDIADGWEEEKPQWHEYLTEFSAKSYALGINIYLYALTH